ncbi:MAG: twin-arginine translocase subunit TatB [Gammaproteobacteria bacterium]|nr:twin-arginine translocase subunit TatB [Gammaproteobacteria bacterium]
MGFWEFALIALVATIVLGPDKLPGAIRSVVRFKRQATQMFQGLSSEVNEQLRVHELHENLKKAEQQGMQDLAPDLQRSVDELKAAANSVNGDIESTSKEVSTQPHDNKN